jgi:hypothetical protein
MSYQPGWMMNLTAITLTQGGFTAFASVGLRWVKQQQQTVENRLDLEARAAAKQAIDVEARLVKAQTGSFNNDSPQARPLELASPDNPAGLDLEVTRYALPARSGQAPRRLYASQSCGLLFESWA